MASRRGGWPVAGRGRRPLMSLRAPIVYCLPEDTARVARAAFPRGNPYLRMYDALGPLFISPDFADLYPEDGQPTEDPAQLALATIFQFIEGLSDVRFVSSKPVAEWPSGG